MVGIFPGATGSACCGVVGTTNTGVPELSAGAGGRGCGLVTGVPTPGGVVPASGLVKINSLVGSDMGSDGRG